MEDDNDSQIYIVMIDEALVNRPLMYCSQITYDSTFTKSKGPFVNFWMNKYGINKRSESLSVEPVRCLKH